MDHQEKLDLLDNYNAWKVRRATQEVDVSADAFLLEVQKERICDAFSDATTTARVAIENLEAIIVREWKEDPTGSGIAPELQAILAQLRTITYP